VIALVSLLLALVPLPPHAPMAPLAQEVPVGDWRAAWDDGRRLEAVEALTVAASSDPTLLPVLVRRLMDVHQYEAALEHALAAGEATRSDAGVCLVLLGRHEEALPLLDPADPLATLMRVDALEMLGLVDEAQAAADEAVAVVGADHPELLAIRGRLLAAQDRDAEAILAFRASLAADPLRTSALFGLGRALLRTGATDEGRAVLAEHRRLLPLIDAHDAAERAVDLSPRHAPNHALLGDAERALGRLAEARRAYERAGLLATDDDRAPVALRHARLLADDLHDTEAAVALLDDLARKVQDARLPVRAGDLLARVGRNQEAALRYALALTWRPTDAQIQARLDLVRSRDG
jgi:tetratricopeptide (TPR) repeat protein